MQTNLLALVGRILLALIFVVSGFGKITNIGGTAGYFGSIGLPLPIVTAWLVALLELLGGLAIVFGFKTRIAALALAAFSIASGLIAHFDLADQMQTIMLMKNTAMAGGLLLLAAYGPGSWSLDRR